MTEIWYQIVIYSGVTGGNIEVRGKVACDMQVAELLWDALKAAGYQMLTLRP